MVQVLEIAIQPQAVEKEKRGKPAGESGPTGSVPYMPSDLAELSPEITDHAEGHPGRPIRPTIRDRFEERRRKESNIGIQ